MRIVDLFSGAGGLTFGFKYQLNTEGAFEENTNNEIVFANEFDAKAAAAFAVNFPGVEMICDDISMLTEERVRSLIEEGPIDLIIGGPPCQSFSTIGKRVYDDKAKMYEEYLRLLKIIRPRMFLFENVKGILSMRETLYQMDVDNNIIYDEESKKPMIDRRGDLIMDIIKEKFNHIDDSFGYKLHCEVLNAVDFGVPQNRKRVFIVGVRNDLDIKWSFPNGNDVKLTIEDGISDLPVVKAGEVILDYNIDPMNEYQQLMRNKNVGLSQHFAGVHGKKIQTIIENVQQGQGRHDFNKLVEQGLVDSEYMLKSGYANTYGRLTANQPSTTITNNMTTPSSLRCIHYDQDRSLTPREGARIQSFPDWFKFIGCKCDVVKQIGNAVPPLVAMALAEKIAEVLGKGGKYE